MSLLKLKSIFSPTNTKFQDNQSDLSTFPTQFDNNFIQTNLQNLDSRFDDGLTTPIQTNLQNLDSRFDDGLTTPIQSNLLDETSIFEEETKNKIETYIDNQISFGDTNLNYNKNQSIPQTFGFDVGLNKPLLDSVLRGRVYDPVRFSTNFTNNNLFVKPETGEITEQLFKDQTFDPRAATPKEGTLYFNTGNTFIEASFPTDFSTAGFNEEAYIPLSELGVSFYNNENSDKNLSWESLYNSNHTPIDLPTWPNAEAGGLSAINYGPNVSRDNLKIGFNKTPYGEKSGFGAESRESVEKTFQISQIGAAIENLTDLPIGREPYVVSNIGNEGREKNRGGRFNPFKRASTDVDRISKFLQSPAGIEFIVKQNINILIPSNIIRRGDDLFRVPQRHNSTLNPFQTLIAAGARGLGEGIPNVKIKKGGIDLPLANLIPGLSSEYGVNSTSAGGSALNPFSNTAFSINDTFTKGVGGGKANLFSTDASGRKALAQSIGSQIPGVSSFVPLNKTYHGDKVTLQDIVSGNIINIDHIAEVATGGGLGFLRGKFKPNKNLLAANLGLNSDTNIPSPSKEENGMPFYFKDLRDKSYIFFRAYIEGLTENISPSYASTNYIGRSEPVYIYERAEREINFTLKLVAQTKEELLMMYKKMDRLTSMCYPEYMDDVYGSRMKPPLSLLRYGEMYGATNKEIMGFIKSISYTVDQSSPYETDPKTGRVPKHISATIAFQVIHSKVPRLGHTFYQINDMDTDPTRLFHQGKLNKQTGLPKI